MSAPHDHHHPSPSWIKAGLAALVCKVSPDCRNVTRLLSRERDHALPFWLRMRLRLHLLACQWCARYAAQLELLGRAMRRTPARLEEANAPALSASGRIHLKQGLREQ